MGVWKRPEQVLAEIETREQVQGLVEPKVPKPAKYRKDRVSHPKRPTLRVGSKLVIPMRRRSSIFGYALGVVLDWRKTGWFGEDGVVGDESDTWTTVTAIVQITKVSKMELQWMVGRLWSTSLYSWSESDVRFTPEEVNQSAYGL